jgi:hypothetical protein
MTVVTFRQGGRLDIFKKKPQPFPVHELEHRILAPVQCPSKGL